MKKTIYEKMVETWRSKVECDNCMNRYLGNNEKCPRCGAYNYLLYESKWIGPVNSNIENGT